MPIEPYAPSLAGEVNLTHTRPDPLITVVSNGTTTMSKLFAFAVLSVLTLAALINALAPIVSTGCEVQNRVTAALAIK